MSLDLSSSRRMDLILYVSSTIFQLKMDESSWVEPVLRYDQCSYSRTLHSDAGDALTRRRSSRVKHITTEPLRSLRRIEEMLT